MRKSLIITIVLLNIQNIYSQNALPIPPVISSDSIQLNIENHTYSFYPGTTTQTMGVNGKILGPTLVLNKNQKYNFSLTNKLKDTTTMHWHGMHVSAENDGGPHSLILPNGIWKPSFKVLDRAATYWYHPHLHGKTNLHVSKGVAGLIIVKDGDEAKLKLPRTYGVDDFPLVLQTKEFDKDQEITIDDEMDTAVVTNGVVDAYLDVPAQVVRFRMVNGTSQRIINLGLSDNKKFHMITSDGGLLEKSIELTRLMLAPGERAEILINLTGMAGSDVSIKSYSSEIPHGFYGGKTVRMMIKNYDRNKLNGLDFDVLKLHVKSKTLNPINSIITDLVKHEKFDTLKVDKYRTLKFKRASPSGDDPNNPGRGPFLINGKSFDMKVINETIPLDNVEVWTIINNTPIAHPFHIHDIQFYIIEKNGVAPIASESGRKDVVLLPPMGGYVRYITKFEDFADDKIPYMYHCHMLTHEDEGMMGQFKVVSKSISLTKTNQNRFYVFPNPVLDVLNFKGDIELHDYGYRIVDVSGRLLMKGSFQNNLQNISITSITKGVYFVSLFNSKGDYRRIQFIKK